MLFLTIVAGMTLLALALVLTPLLRAPRGPEGRAEADLRIYRDQLTEVEAERSRGAIDTGEASAARHEIERRIVRSFAAARAERTAAPRPVARRRRTITIALTALAVPVAAGTLYARLGAPGPSGMLPWEPSLQQRQVTDFQNLLRQLESKVRAEPNRVEGWVLLGRMYDAAQRFADAGDAFDHAAALRPDSPDIAIAAAQSRIMAADGAITPDALKQIDRALALDPRHPGARYFKALAQWQAGQRKAAYAAWNDLLRDSPPDAPWLPELRARVTEAADALGLPPPKEAETASAAPPGPDADAVARAARMTPEQRQAMIRSMVASLAARLKAEPDDLGGWMRLARSYGVLGERAKAVAAFEQARKLSPHDPDVLVGLGQARAQAGDRAGALAALRAAEARLAAGDPRRDQVDQMIRSFQPAKPGPR